MYESSLVQFVSKCGLYCSICCFKVPAHNNECDLALLMSIKGSVLTVSFIVSRPWMLAQMTDKEYCQAKKVQGLEFLEKV